MHNQIEKPVKIKRRKKENKNYKFCQMHPKFIWGRATYFNKN